MNILFRALLAIAVAFSISCSKGGASDSEAANNANNSNTPGNGGQGQKPGTGTTQDAARFKNIPNSVQGMWSDGSTYNLFVSDKTMKLVGFCDQNKTVEIEVAVSLTTSSITAQETKAAGVANSGCSISIEKGDVYQFTVSGDDLAVNVKGQQFMFSRIQNLPTTPNNPGNGGSNNGGGNTGGTISFELFTGANCQGTKVIYTVGMNCAQLNGTVTSLRQSGQQQCTNINQALQASQICESINQQAAGQ